MCTVSLEDIRLKPTCGAHPDHQESSQQKVQTTSSRSRRQFHMSCNCLLCQFCWSSADQGMACSVASFSQVVAVPFSCSLATCMMIATVTWMSPSATESLAFFREQFCYFAILFWWSILFYWSSLHFTRLARL